MKNKNLNFLWVLFLGLIAFNSCSKDTTTALVGNWKTLGDFGGEARYGASTFTIGDTAYIFGGSGSIKSYFNDLWKYDLKSGSWTKVICTGTLPTPRKYSVAFSLNNNKGYVGTGYDEDGKVLNDFYEFDPTTSNWSKKADFIGNGRYYAIGFGIKEYGYIGLGYNVVPSPQNDFYKYDPSSDSWAQIPDFSRKIAQANVFVIDDIAYVGGGLSSGEPVLKLFKFNPANSNAWTELTDLSTNVARYSATAFSINKKGYFALGKSTSSSFINTVYEYDPSNDSWTQKTSFSKNSRVDAVGISVGGKGIIATGTDGNYPLVNYFEFFPDAANVTTDDN